MSYDIYLCDHVTEEHLTVTEPHQMRGGLYAIGGTTELWLNVTYNYSRYYYEANEKGIRAIYGTSGAESIPILESMIKAIEDKYKDADGQWIEGERTRIIYRDRFGSKIDLLEYVKYKYNGATKEEQKYIVSEGDTSDYWEETAANAIRPLHQLIAMAKMRPDGTWKGD